MISGSQTLSVSVCSVCGGTGRVKVEGSCLGDSECFSFCPECFPFSGEVEFIFCSCGAMIAPDMDKCLVCYIEDGRNRFSE